MSVGELGDANVGMLHQGQLVNFWTKRFVEGEGAQEERAHYIGRRALQVGAVGVAIGGRLPFIAISRKFGGKNKAYGWALAYGDGASLGCLVAWSYLKMIGAGMRPLSTEERALMSVKRHKGCQVALKVVYVALSLISLIPLADLVLNYNDHQWIYPVIVMCSEAGPSIYSLHLTEERARLQRTFVGFEKTLYKVKLRLIEAIQKRRADLVQGSARRRNALVGRIYPSTLIAADVTQEAHESIRCLVESLHETRYFEKSCAAWCWSYVPWTVGYLYGALATFVRLAGSAVFTYDIAKYVWNEEWFAGGMAGLVVLVIAYLSAKAIFGSARGLSDKVFLKPHRLIIGSSLEARLAPIARGALWTFSVGTVAMAHGPPIQIARDYFSGGFRTFMEINQPAAVILLVLFAFEDLVDEAVGSGILAWSNGRDRDAIACDRNLERAEEVIRKSSLREFALFLSWLPDDVLNLLVSTESFKEKLGGYLEEPV